MNGVEIEHRDPGIVLVLSVFTCGLYLLYWYYKMYEELAALAGDTPTGFDYWVDLLLTVVTCGLYGIWADYKISIQLGEVQRSRAMQGAPNTAMAAVGLDVVAPLVGFMTNFITSAIQQDQLNKVMRVVRESPYRGGT